MGPERLTPAGHGDVLVVEGVSKTFGGVRALRGARLAVRAGEIHGLVGENGSGKSTLIKLLAGFHAPDEPTAIEVCGESAELPLKPGEAARLGMAFVHQDLGLIPGVSVLENLLMEEFATRRSWRLSWRRQRRRAREMLAGFGVSLDLDQPVGQIRPTERALLAIARAAARVRELRDEDSGAGSGLLVLDEPTVYLPVHERERLFDLMRSVAAAGLGIVFVSHDVDEVIANTHRVTVLRDGRVVDTVDSAESMPERLISLILGRELAARGDSDSPAAPGGGERFRVTDLSGRAARGLSLELEKGEIVGVTGLPGAGYDDVPYLLFGAERPVAGTLTLDGDDIDLRSMTPARAVERGIALIPADRAGAGAVGSLPVVDNVSLQVLGRYRRGPVLERGRMVREAEAAAREFDVRPRDPRIDYSSLSGGNQQKALLAKWFLTSPRLLLLHEPTQGVDVGARGEIFDLLRRAARDGCAIVVASSDHEQLAVVCNRVAVVRSGRVALELRGASVTKEAITDACYTTPGTPEVAA